MMNTVEEIKRIAAKIKADPSLAARLSDTADLVDEVGLDSLEMLQFMLEIEASLAIEVDFERLSYDHLESLTDLASFLDSMPRQ